MNGLAIKVAQINKTFRLPHERATGLKQAIVTFYRRRRGYEAQQVLKNIDFEIQAGEFFGIVGRNGSGKSTLLKLLAGVYVPDSGVITINGSLTPFIELGVGFNPELTGRENVYLNGALLGFSHKQMDAMYDEIVAFAELERFMDQKLKNYSSGMQVRLAFSIAIRAKSDVLLIDEVLAVGDAIFQKKCYDYFRQLKKEGRTVVFVSHDTAALQEYCDRGILVEKGDIITAGKIDQVVKDYLDLLNAAEAKQQDQPDDEVKQCWGSGDMSVDSVAVRDPATGNAKKIFSDDDQLIQIDVQFSARRDVLRPVYGITVSDLTGKIVFQSNTLWCNVPTHDMAAGSSIKVTWKVPNAFNGDTFMVSPAAADTMGSEIYEWREDVAQFKVRKQQKSHGVINVAHELTLHE